MSTETDEPKEKRADTASALRMGRNVYERYLPLIRRIAMKMVRQLPRAITLDDLLSSGWTGLVEALRRRTPKMTEDEFEAYASQRIRGAILDYLRSLDPMSRRLRGASRDVTAAISTLIRRLGRPPEEEEIAAELGIDLESYQALLGQARAIAGRALGAPRARRSDRRRGVEASREAPARARPLLPGRVQLPRNRRRARPHRITRLPAS
jgi:RNA polymerase sigma factor (sigma-70 family)